MIKNIILDLGGVIINIDYQLTIKAFTQLGVANAELFYSKQQQVTLFDLLETGKIPPNEFRNQIRKLTNTNLSDEQIDSAWNAMLLDFPPQRIAILSQLKTKYKTFLLSNTNEIHYKTYTQLLQREFGEKDLSAYFHKEYYSHITHIRKPDPEAFKIIIHEQNILPEETLFVDDSEQHITTADTLGFQTHLLKNETLETYISKSKFL